MRYRNLAALSVLALLGACWQADQPLIPNGEADSPPKILGTYDIVSEANGPDGTATVSKSKTAGFFDYEAKDPKGLVLKRLLRFDRLSGEWYLVQSQNVDADKGAGQPNFRFLKIAGDKIEEYEPSCDLTEAAIPNVAVNDGDCTFADYKGLKAAAQNRLKQAQGGDEASLSLQNSFTKKTK
ncbi:hypothetical protein [Altererythrobacter fulvus]|uniref:hypothetical protein n=1 Tax=Caenibius fulvus TaxID=2126012 RepID=UPI00301ABD2C